MDTSKSLSLSAVETILSEQLDEAKNEIIRLKSLIPETTPFQNIDRIGKENEGKKAAVSWVNHTDRRPEVDRKYFCRRIDSGVRMYIWKDEITNQHQWLDDIESTKNIAAVSDAVESEGFVVYDSIDGEFREIEKMEEAIQYVKGSYVDGHEMHPDFDSFDIYKKVAEVYVEEDEKGNSLAIKIKKHDESTSEPIDQSTIDSYRVQAAKDRHERDYWKEKYEELKQQQK